MNPLPWTSAAILLLALCGMDHARAADSGSLTTPIVVPDFAVLNAQAPGTDTSSPRDCVVTSDSSPATLDETKGVADSIDAALPAKLADEVASKLTAHSAHVVYRDPRLAPASALVVEGCIVRADPGDAGKRLVGMNLGASKLSAHVKVYRTGSMPKLEDEFDVAVEGVNKAPPIGPVGLVVHGIKERHQTLSADAEKAAGLIAKHILAGRCVD